jgi:hypothetical protein
MNWEHCSKNLWQSTRRGSEIISLYNRGKKKATAAKEMWVANLVEPWRGDQSSVPVLSIF